MTTAFLVRRSEDVVRMNPGLFETACVKHGGYRRTVSNGLESFGVSCRDWGFLDRGVYLLTGVQPSKNGGLSRMRRD